MQKSRRVAIFALGVVAILIATANLTSFILGVWTGGAVGGVSIGLCGVSSPDRMALGVYLEARASELEAPAGDDDTAMTFIIEPGETVTTIAQRLAEQHLISDAELFRRYVQYHGLDAGIEAGKFTLRQTMTIPQIAQALQEAQRPEQEITVREGLRLEQVAEEIGAQTNIPPDEFLALVTTGWRKVGLDSEFDFLTDLPEGATLEGFLFPDTYRIDEEAAPVDLARRMLETFAARVPLDMRAAAANQGLNTYEMVTLASIVEREAVLEEERPVIAGVYHNRLRAGWLLAADPTVQFGLGTPGNWWPELTLDDLQVDHPSNTYKYQGLPPGPICNPGLGALRAAAYPAETEYYFFMADCTKDDGSHLFSVTEEEHFQNYEACGGGR